MLKMKCPKCDEMIVSALLSEIDTVGCGHCKEVVPVGDVLIYAEGFTFHRNDLVKRLFRYKTLLNEVRKEREMLEKSTDASDESKKSLDRFLQALEEVMAGARNHLRLDFSDRLPVRFRCNEQIQTGFLSNLSMSGACIELSPKTAYPKKKAPISVCLSLPGCNDDFTLPAVVSWINKEKTAARKANSIGVEFKSLNQKVVDILWDFIASAASVS